MQKRKRDQSRQLQKDEHKLLETPRKKQNCAVAEEMQNCAVAGIKMEKVIQSFSDSMTCGYRSSVTRCDANKYNRCTKNLLKKGRQPFLKNRSLSYLDDRDNRLQILPPFT